MPTPNKDQPAKKPAPKRKKPAAKKPGGHKGYTKPADALVNVEQPDPRAEARKSSIAKCDEYGIEQIVDDIMDGVPLMHIAMRIEVPLSSFYRWADITPGAAERMLAARKHTAQQWEEMAEKVVAEAKNPFELMRAKELAHHYRWRAACISPKFNPSAKQDDKKSNDDPVAAMRALADKLPD
jgi:hypothetical protein